MIKLGSKVTVKPLKGCCNNTLCFTEWKVLDIATCQFKVIKERVAIIASGDQIEVVAVSRLQEVSNGKEKENRVETSVQAS